MLNNIPISEGQTTLDKVLVPKDDKESKKKKVIRLEGCSVLKTPVTSLSLSNFLISSSNLTSIWWKYKLSKDEFYLKDNITLVFVKTTMITGKKSDTMSFSTKLGFVAGNPLVYKWFEEMLNVNEYQFKKSFTGKFDVIQRYSNVFNDQYNNRNVFYITTKSAAVYNAFAGVEKDYDKILKNKCFEHTKPEVLKNILPEIVKANNYNEEVRKANQDSEKKVQKMKFSYPCSIGFKFNTPYALVANAEKCNVETERIINLGISYELTQFILLDPSENRKKKKTEIVSKDTVKISMTMATNNPKSKGGSKGGNKRKKPAEESKNLADDLQVTKEKTSVEPVNKKPKRSHKKKEEKIPDVFNDLLKKQKKEEAKNEKKSEVMKK